MPTKLQTIRRQRGMTQAELAKAAGVARQYITNIESGQRDFGGISARIAVRIADALRVNVKDLID